MKFNKEWPNCILDFIELQIKPQVDDLSTDLSYSLKHKNIVLKITSSQEINKNNNMTAVKI